MKELDFPEGEELSQAIDQFIAKYSDASSDASGVMDFLNIITDVLDSTDVRRADKPSSTGNKASLNLLAGFLKQLEPTFSEKLMQLIHKKGRKPSEIYTKAGITRAHFSKIKSDKNYHPTKETALAFAVALHLSIDETEELLRCASYSLSHSSISDMVVEFFIVNGFYNIDEINIQLYNRNCKTLTNWRNN